MVAVIIIIGVVLIFAILLYVKGDVKRNAKYVEFIPKLLTNAYCAINTNEQGKALPFAKKLYFTSLLGCTEYITKEVFTVNEMGSAVKRAMQHIEKLEIPSEGALLARDEITALYELAFQIDSIFLKKVSKASEEKISKVIASNMKSIRKMIFYEIATPDEQMRSDMTYQANFIINKNPDIWSHINKFSA